MNELWQCNTCDSLVSRDQINGRCKICGVFTCRNCVRVCDRCQGICCMHDIESKIVMRQQRPFIHKLCNICREVW